MNPPADAQLLVIDSHTAGEPTRVVVEGAPFPAGASPKEVRTALRERADWVRSSLTLEPRGAAWMVGAVLTPPTRDDCAAGVVFFNNTGYLGMCGHGLIGVVTTLYDQGRVGVGEVRVETPVGLIVATLHADGSVSFDNVLSHRSRRDVVVDVPGVGSVVGDIAYGGNWFFLTKVPRLGAHLVHEHTNHAKAIRRALAGNDITGDDGAEIDHIELVGPPSDPNRASAKNFVLCPGSEYDRSPCGTGTSAKVACLAADGRLAPGELWTQESILGGCFQATYRPVDGGVIPNIRGRAFVTGETRVRFDPEDPYRSGFLVDVPEEPLILGQETL